MRPTNGNRRLLARALSVRATKPLAESLGTRLLCTELKRLHHVTAIANEPQTNINLICRCPWRSLVKRTVNFDHLPPVLRFPTNRPGPHTTEFGRIARNLNSNIPFFFAINPAKTFKVRPGAQSRLYQCTLRLNCKILGLNALGTNPGTLAPLCRPKLDEFRPAVVPGPPMLGLKWLMALKASNRNSTCFCSCMGKIRLTATVKVERTGGTQEVTSDIAKTKGPGWECRKGSLVKHYVALRCSCSVAGLPFGTSRGAARERC